jgi:DNA helicase-2/ATP-dependent DNA helicase PcrA
VNNLNQILNKEQYSAVTLTKGPVLILAGAGSGKTRVITYKIVHLVNSGINPKQILAVTFTNKAANEMKERISLILKNKKIGVLVTTFHSLGVKILKSEIKVLGYRSQFSIYDQYDSKRLITDIINELKLSLEKYNPDLIGYIISNLKRNKNYKIEDKNIYNIFDKYQKYLKNYNAVDFDDLILLPIEILSKKSDILKKYQKKWKYILVDEYQDTSLRQYELIRLLSIDHKNITVVGDDDQSIYSWRGANIENINKFEKDFHPVKEVRLEQNYRSKGNILDAANSVIKFNKNRKAKVLWTKDKKGEKIKLYKAMNEEDEANFIYTITKRLIDSGYQYKDIAVLFRMNSQSRIFEEVFREYDIPYKMIGAMKFFDRPEVRDILSYIRFLANTNDEVSLLRIINNPKRGIGNTTLLALMKHTKNTNSTLYGTIKDFVRSNILGTRTTAYLEDFYNLIEKYRELIFKPKNIANTVQKLVEEIDYKAKLITEIKDLKRINYKLNNINQLVQSISRYENDSDNFEPNVYEYINKVSLQTRNDEVNDNNLVNMMSIHASKGLEFKIIFLVGVEEGLLPHHKTMIEAEDDEEERRLFYVAITRAQDKLFLSYTKKRLKFNEEISIKKSKYLDELPKAIIEKIDLASSSNNEEKINSLLSKWKN